MGVIKAIIVVYEKIKININKFLFINININKKLAQSRSVLF